MTDPWPVRAVLPPAVQRVRRARRARTVHTADTEIGDWTPWETPEAGNLVVALFVTRHPDVAVAGPAGYTRARRYCWWRIATAGEAAPQWTTSRSCDSFLEVAEFTT